MRVRAFLSSAYHLTDHVIGLQYNHVGREAVVVVVYIRPATDSRHVIDAANYSVQTIYTSRTPPEPTKL